MVQRVKGVGFRLDGKFVRESMGEIGSQSPRVQWDGGAREAPDPNLNVPDQVIGFPGEGGSSTLQPKPYEQT